MDGRPARGDRAGALLVAAGAAYPLLVYAGSSLLPPSAIALAALALIGLRLLLARRRGDGAAPTGALLAAGSLLALLLALDPDLAVRAYPVAASLAAAAVFGLSLVFPPPLVERIARLRQRELAPAEISYTRAVTVVWTVFLLANAAVSALVGLRGSLALWTLYNGLVSYLLMGALLAGELLVRRRLRRRLGLSS